MCMYNTLTQLRTSILGKLKKDEMLGFSTNVDECLFAHHPNRGMQAGNPMYDDNTWESVICIRDGIKIILQYRNRGNDGAQSVMINGKRFNAIGLFIYDENPLPANARAGIHRNEVRNTVAGYLQDINQAEYVIGGINNGFGNAVGHVLDLFISVRENNPWTIPGDENTLVNEAAKVLKDLLRAADQYGKNRNNIFN